MSSAERRSLINSEKNVNARVSDIYGAIAAINGKIELVYEGEVEGPVYVAQSLIGKAMRTEFLKYFPNPEAVKKKKSGKNPFQQVSAWFGEGNVIDFTNDLTDREYRARLKTIEGLEELVKQVRGKSVFFMGDNLLEISLATLLNTRSASFGFKSLRLYLKVITVNSRIKILNSFLERKSIAEIIKE